MHPAFGCKIIDQHTVDNGLSSLYLCTLLTALLHLNATKNDSTVEVPAQHHMPSNLLGHVLFGLHLHSVQRGRTGHAQHLPGTYEEVCTGKPINSGGHARMVPGQAKDLERLVQAPHSVN